MQRAAASWVIDDTHRERSRAAWQCSRRSPQTASETLAHGGTLVKKLGESNSALANRLVYTREACCVCCEWLLLVSFVARCRHRCPVRRTDVDIAAQRTEVSIAVDVLSQEGHLPHAVISQSFHFLDNAVRRPRSFSAPASTRCHQERCCMQPPTTFLVGGLSLFEEWLYPCLQGGCTLACPPL